MHHQKHNTETGTEYSIPPEDMQEKNSLEKTTSSDEDELISTESTVKVIDNLIAIFYKDNRAPSRELAIECAKAINSGDKLVKTSLYLVWDSGSFKKLGHKTMKSFIIKETNLTYDAGLKKLEAAKTCAEHFGIEKIGFFSDSSMRTLARIPTRAVREKVITKICHELNVDRSSIPWSVMTSQKVQDVMHEVTKRPFFSKDYKLNYMDRDVYDENYTSTSSNLLNYKSEVYDKTSLEETALDESFVLKIAFDSTDPNHKYILNYEYSTSEIRQILSVKYPNFYDEHIKNTYYSHAELVYVALNN